MQIDVTELGPCRKKVSIAVPVERVNQEFQKNYKEISSGMNIPGFRKGRVPRAVLRKRFGERIAHQVKAALLHEMLKAVEEDHEIDVVRNPDIDIESLSVAEEKTFDLEIELEVKPDFELPEYKGIEVDAITLEVKDEAVAERIERLRRQYGELAPVEGEEIAIDDHLVVDLDVTFEEVEGAPDNFSSENRELMVREGAIIPTLSVDHTSFVGKKAGDEVSGELTFGEDHDTVAFRGHKASYTIKINAHKRLELPELDEEFFGELEVEDEAALKAKITEELERELRAQEEHELEQAIVTKLCEGADFEIPDTVLGHERQRMRDSVDMRLRREQPALSAGERDAKANEELEANEDEIKAKIRRTYILEKIGRKEEIEATEADVDERIEAMARANEIWPHQLREWLQERNMIESLYGDIQLEKVRAFLRDNAKINDA